MQKQELRAAVSLAAVFSVRMLGLFMIYPVFAVFARQLAGATPYKIGLALGIYGLSQGLLQMPFGLLSDRVGRKTMIVFGLVLFALGSAVAASARSIDGMIWGRVLQGAGAVGSVILALVADLTAEENRIENFEPGRTSSRLMRWLTRIGGVRDPDGGMPRDMRLSFRQHKAGLRSAIERMIAWNPERIILAHGRWYTRAGTYELRRAFGWLLG